MYWACISGTGECCYSARVTNSNRKDEALSAESINPNNSFQTNKVSYGAEFAILMFMFLCEWLTWFNFGLILADFFEANVEFIGKNHCFKFHAFRKKLQKSFCLKPTWFRSLLSILKWLEF